MRITGAESTLLFTGTASQPLQVVRVSVADNDAADAPGAASARRAETAPLTVRVEGAGVSTPVPFRVMGIPGANGEWAAEVAVRTAAPHGPGSVLPATVIAERGEDRASLDTVVTVAEPGWTIWMVSHFHYDPVWWDTQGQFTESRLLLPDDKGELPEVRTAFELVRLHLDAARDDPDYKFVLAEVDYLKPYFDVHPEDRAELRELIAAGRVEVVGGMYNEPNTNLTGAESTVRNIVYGLGHQRDVRGADPGVGWMLDAFGFDPAYPGLMSDAGLHASSWARGPYHQWGPRRTVGDNTRMQFPSEFEWVSPDGHGLLTSYMPNHYGAGWVALNRSADLAAAQDEALVQLATMAPVAATRNILLPVGEDHTIPARWAADLHRRFAERYLWPRCVTALPSDYFAAVRAEASDRGTWFTPQSRDMNPVYPGKDVTYTDTKQAQRAAEVAVCDGERLATLAWLAGADYPAESLDKAWRQLVFGAHHDAITGTESDQVYLDLLGGWREAFERGDAARRAAAAFLADLTDTRPPAGAAARPVAVVNTLSWARSALATVRLEFTAGEAATWLVVRDAADGDVPFLAEGVRRHPGGALAEVTVTFRAEVPALGVRTYWVGPAASDGEQEAGWTAQPGTRIENDAFGVAADPAAGGTLSRVYDRRSGADLLRGHGNELTLQEEYDYHPRWGEGPWLLSPKGAGTGSGQRAASVRSERCPLGSRLVAELEFAGLRVTQETRLWDGVDRVDFLTHTDGSGEQDRLLRVRFPLDLPGGLPVFQCATSVVGRTPGVADTDVSHDPFTLDTPAHQWFGLGSTARVTAGGHAWALGVAEVVLPAEAGAAGDGATHDVAALREAVAALVSALAAQGVTATCSQPDGPRYGALDVDSNLPDFRVALGGADRNPWTGRLAATLGPEAAAMLARMSGTGRGRPLWLPAARQRAEVFGPNADVRGERDLPVLVVDGTDLAEAIHALVADLTDSVVEADLARPGPGARTGPGPDALAAHRSVALFNRGTPGSIVTPDGTLCVSLMRANSAWPCGVWIDGEKRTTPDGTSFAWQHWSHTFAYALASGAGDWRDAGFTVAAEEYNHDLLTFETTTHPGPLPSEVSLGDVSTPLVPRPLAILSALKPRGNPLAAGGTGTPDRRDGVTVRLRDGGRRPSEPVPAHVRLFTDVTRARLSDVTEAADRAALPVAGGEVEAPVPAGGVVTLALSTAASPMLGVAETRRPVPPEPAQPVFTRYWLHGKGPAPAGNLPVAVHLSPTRVALSGPDGDGTAPGPALPTSAVLGLSVACGPQPARGQVTLDVPAGLAVTLPDGSAAGPLDYHLGPDGYECWELLVRVCPGTRAGRYYATARITDGLGQVLEDAVLVTVGEPAEPDLDLPLVDVLPLIEAGQRRDQTETDVSLGPVEVAVAPGEQADLVARVTNRTAGPLRGECQLVSPWGTWQHLTPWTQGFEVAEGGTAEVRFPVAVPGGVRPGSQWWALAKVMYFGRVRYTESVRVTVTEPAR